MSNRTGRIVFAALAVLCGAAGSFVVTTVAMDRISDSALVGLSCAIALAVSLAARGGSGVSEIRNADRGAVGLAAAAGALAFWAAPLMALSQRASDAPSGADSLFFTTSIWGLACVAVAYAVASQRPPLTALAGAVGAVAGAAGLLASWESPSSFSPFAKFPLREALMVVAGVLFAAGALALADAARRLGPRIALSAALGGATALGLLAALQALPTASDVARGELMVCVYLGIAIALLAYGWTYLSADVGVSRASSPLLGVPVLVMALTGVERLTNVRGPDPITWSGALAGAGVIAVCAVTIWLAEAPACAPVSPRPPLWLPLGLALTSSLLAVASLATPALNALAEGGTGEPFQAAWTMVGAESAAGWLVFAAAGLALASVLVARRGGAKRSWMPSAAAVVVCAVAAAPLIGTTLHTWNRWVPAEVQQTYGTEYSRLLIEPRLEPVRLAAILLALVAVAALSLTARRGSRIARTPEEVSR